MKFSKQSPIMGHNSSDVDFNFWKGKGDFIFQVNSNKKNLALVVYVERMTRALSYYHKAATYTTNADEKATIAEKLAATQFKCGQRLHENYTISASTLPKNSHQESRLLIDYYLKESLIQYERASEYDANIKSPEWMEKVSKCGGSCAELLWNLHQVHHLETEKSFSHQIGRLEVLCQRTEGIFRHIFYFKLVFDVMEQAKKLKNMEKYGEASQLLHDNQMRIEKLQLIESDYTELKLDCNKLLNEVESMKAMQKGDGCWTSVELSVDEILKHQTKTKSEELCDDYILEAADWYKTAINLARLSNSPKIEAKAHVQLGRLYESKMKFKSMEHYKIACEIANMLPAAETFKNQEWYQHCLNGLYRLESLRNWQHNIVNRESLRKQIRQQLSSQLVELAQESKRPVNELLDFIYNKYPPRDCGKEQPKGTNLKINLKKALVHYHPDKQNVERFGLHWIVLSEEITVILTSSFSRLFRA